MRKYITIQEARNMALDTLKAAERRRSGLGVAKLHQGDVVPLYGFCDTSMVILSDGPYGIGYFGGCCC